MGIVNSDDVQFLAYHETSLGGPGTTAEVLQPNGSPEIGADITTISRDNMISKDRQVQSSSTSDLDSKFVAEMDLTMNALRTFAPLTWFADFTSPYAGLADGAPFRPTAVTSTGFTVAASGALTAGTLIRARGFANAANNGLHVVGASSTGTEIKTSGLVAETTTVAMGATVEICGVQFAASDAEIDSDGNLITTTFNLTALGLTRGCAVIVGGDTAATSFAVAANIGMARVSVTPTANLMTLDKKLTTFAVDDGNLKTIQLFFGPFLRNVASDHADFNRASITVEADLPGAHSGGTASMYIASRGLVMDECKLNMPMKGKATMNVSMVGLDTDAPTASQLSGGTTARIVTQKEILNTSAQFSRLRVTEYDETGLSSYFDDAITVTIKNGAVAKKVQAQLEALGINYGTFTVTMDSTLVLYNTDVLAAVRNNTTLTAEVGMANADGGFVIDFPSIKAGGGKPGITKNDSVRVPLAVRVEKDTSFGYSASLTLFPYVPAYLYTDG